MRVLCCVLVCVGFGCSAKEPLHSASPKQTSRVVSKDEAIVPASKKRAAEFSTARWVLVGDSFIAGFAGLSPEAPNPTGIRSELLVELKKRHREVEWLGSQKTRAVPGLPVRHEGYPGETIEQISQRLFGAEGAVAKLPKTEFSVVLWAGYNDAFRGPIPFLKYQALVEKFLSLPQVSRVVVVNLVCNAHPTRDQRNMKFNHELSGWMKRKPSSRLKLADVASAIDCPAELVDGLHLRSSGDEKASHVIINALFSTN